MFVFQNFTYVRSLLEKCNEINKLAWMKINAFALHLKMCNLGKNHHWSNKSYSNVLSCVWNVLLPEKSLLKWDHAMHTLV